jgi:hypothetical protein
MPNIHSKLLKLVNKFFSASIILSMLLSVLISNGQAVTYFKKSYGDAFPFYENGFFVKALTDGYLTGGEKIIGLTGESDLVVFKTSVEGDLTNSITETDSTTNCYFRDAVNLGNYWVLAGGFEENSTSLGQSFLMKMDTSGNIIWRKYLGDSLTENESFCISRTLDNGFVLGGVIVNSQGYWEANLIKTDSTGNEEWSRYYPSSSNSTIRQVEQNADSSFTFIGGYNMSLSDGSIRLMHTDKYGFEDTSGIYIFTTLPNLDQNQGFSFSKTNDKGYVISARTGGFALIRTIIFKVDSNFQIVWTNPLSSLPAGAGNPWINYCDKVIVLPDQSIVACGGMTSYINSMDIFKILLIKFDSSGTELWRRRYTYNSNENNYGYDFDTTADGGFVIAGRAELGSHEVDACLLKTNCLGFLNKPAADFSVTWNNNEATFYNLSQRADACIYYFGDGDSSIVLLTDTVPIVHQYSGAGPWQAYLLAFACGEVDTIYQTITTGIELLDDFYESTFSIYPNPVSNYLNISYQLPKTSTKAEIALYDCSGKIILLRSCNSLTKNLELNISEMSVGSYIAAMVVDGKIMVREKVIILR